MMFISRIAGPAPILTQAVLTCEGKLQTFCFITGLVFLVFLLDASLHGTTGQDYSLIMPELIAIIACMILPAALLRRPGKDGSRPPGLKGGLLPFAQSAKLSGKADEKSSTG